MKNALILLAGGTGKRFTFAKNTKPKQFVKIGNNNFIEYFLGNLDEKTFSPSRLYTGDGTTAPIKENKYKTKYKKLMINLIKKNKISVIYIIAPLDSAFIYNYIDRQCFEENYVLEQLTRYEIKNCVDINS